MAPTERDLSQTGTLLSSDKLNPVHSKYSHPKELSKCNNEYYIKDRRNVPWYIKYKFKWPLIILFLVLYPTATYGFLTFPYVQKYKTVLWTLLIQVFTTLGVTAGAHRLWSHKAFKAKLPLQIFLATAFVTSLQVPFSYWIRLHRLHHKYTDTDADPYDSTKGFFFTHLGFLLIKRPKDVVDKYKEIDMSDIKKNPVTGFFDRHVAISIAIATGVTILVPVYFWNEEWTYAFMAQVMRAMAGYNIAASVNSIAHAWGNKPFNSDITPTDNKLVAYFSLGEGWHNYHHVFPFDYRTPEFTGYFDFSGKVIELFEKIGWAYDLRKPSDDFVKRVIKNKGDAFLQTFAN